MNRRGNPTRPSPRLRLVHPLEAPEARPHHQPAHSARGATALGLIESEPPAEELEPASDTESDDYSLAMLRIEGRLGWWLCANGVPIAAFDEEERARVVLTELQMVDALRQCVDHLEGELRSLLDSPLRSTRRLQWLRTLRPSVVAPA